MEKQLEKARADVAERDQLLEGYTTLPQVQPGRTEEPQPGSGGTRSSAEGTTVGASPQSSSGMCPTVSRKSVIYACRVIHIDVHLHGKKAKAKANFSLWYLSLLNMNIKLDFLWTHLKAMWLSLSHPKFLHSGLFTTSGCETIQNLCDNCVAFRPLSLYREHAYQGCMGWLMTRHYYYSICV